jgi:hypothetical protein
MQINLGLNCKRERGIEPVTSRAQAAQAPADNTLNLWLIEKLALCRSHCPASSDVAASHS